jgi:predicted GTPase
VLVIEDGPTLTHGGMAYGAGYVAARGAQAAEIIDPRPFAAPAVARVYDHYPHIGEVLPAVGYSTQQLAALELTINASDAELIVSATPADLAALLRLDKPVVRARYEFAEAEGDRLCDLIQRFLRERRLT